MNPRNKVNMYRRLLRKAKGERRWQIWHEVNDSNLVESIYASPENRVLKYMHEMAQDRIANFPGSRVTSSTGRYDVLIDLGEDEYGAPKDAFESFIMGLPKRSYLPSQKYLMLYDPEGGGDPYVDALDVQFAFGSWKNVPEFFYPNEARAESDRKLQELEDRNRRWMGDDYEARVGTRQRSQTETKRHEAHVKTAAPGTLTWPVYTDEAALEKEQIENVFGLGGGELEHESFAGYKYNYEGPPDYAEEIDDDFNYQYRTVIVSGGGHLPPPDKTLEHEGVTWELVDHFMSSGESDCWVCGAGGNGKEWWAEEFEKQHGRPPTPEDECGLCEYKFADMPGSTHIGEGYEVVYRVHNDVIWPEDEY